LVYVSERRKTPYDFRDLQHKLKKKATKKLKKKENLLMINYFHYS
jgi:hypothetical protein